MRVLVKVGGAQLEADAARADLARSVAAARTDGIDVVLVHGGGAQIRALSRRLSVEDRYHDGLRITDDETSEIALMTLGGTVSRKLVLALERAGVRAVGLTGADGSTITAVPHRPGGRDLGYVGVPARIRPELVEALMAFGAVPVMATVAPLEEPDPMDPGRFFNINADHVVAPLARALGCDVILFVTDVDGVRGAAGSTLRRLTPSDAAVLRERGTIHGGMIPKVDAALDAVAGHPGARVKIVPAGPDAVRRGLSADLGTRFAPDDPPVLSALEGRS